MSRLVFEVQAPVVAADPNRADIACFVGFVARRKNTLVPSAILRWLNEQGWIASDPTRPNQFGDKMRYSSNAVNDLLDVPVPIDSWEVTAPAMADLGHSFLELLHRMPCQ